MIPLCPNVTNPRGLGFWGFSVLGKGGKLKKKELRTVEKAATEEMFL